MAKRSRRNAPIIEVRFNFSAVTRDQRDDFLQALDQAVRRRGGQLLVGDGVHQSVNVAQLDERVRRALEEG